MIWIVILLFTIWSLSQLWYFRTYNDLMPFTSYLLFDNVSALLLDSVIGSMKMIDLLIVVPVIFLFLLDRFYLKKMKRGSISKVIKGLCISAIIFVSLSMYLTFGVTYYWNEKGKLVTSIWGRYINGINYTHYFQLNGFVALGIHSMVETMLEWRELTSEEKMVIEQFLQSDITCYSDNRFSVMGDKNLILIIVESLNSWVIDLKIDDEEITPNLNSYCREDNSIVALRIQPQVKDGRSSDAHFIYNTGLLPIKNGATAVRFGACNYPSLAKALKGYSSFGVVCDKASIWNQEVTSHSYGFKKLYDALSYVGKKGEITSLFRTSVTSAVLWSGEVAGDTEAELIPAQGEAWNISDLIITKHYFATEKKE